MSIETTATLIALGLIGTAIALPVTVGYLAGLPVWATAALTGSAVRGLTYLPRLFPAPSRR